VLRITRDNIKVLATSRPECDIAEIFSEQPQLQITDGIVKEDIAVHINWILTHDKKLKSLKLGFKSEIREHLLSKSYGMYLDPFTMHIDDG